MRGPVHRRAAGAAVLCLGLAVASSATASSTGPAPRRDTFSGKIVSATGSYAGDSGRATMYLHPHGSGHTRTVGVRFQGGVCPPQREPPCREVTGTLTGTLTRAASVPDAGNRYTLMVTGNLSGLGSVTGTGWVQGTGNIGQGYEQMKLKLSHGSGSVTLRAHSPLVKGFTSP